MSTVNQILQHHMLADINLWMAQNGQILNCLVVVLEAVGEGGSELMSLSGQKS